MGMAVEFRVSDGTVRDDSEDFFRTYVEVVLGKARESGFRCADVHWRGDVALLRFVGNGDVQVFVNVRSMGDGYVSDNGKPHLPSVRYSYDARFGNRIVSAGAESETLSPDTFDSRMRSSLDLVAKIADGFGRSGLPDMGSYLDRLEGAGVVPWLVGDGDPGDLLAEVGRAVDRAVG